MTAEPAVLFVHVHNAGRSKLDDPVGPGSESVHFIGDDIRRRVEALIVDTAPAGAAA